MPTGVSSETDWRETSKTRRIFSVGTPIALAISSGKRLPDVDIPTLKEQGIDVEISNWRAIFGAPGITDAQRKELTDIVTRAVKTPSWQETLKRNDWEDAFLAGDAFKTFLDADTKRIGDIVAGLGLRK